MSHEGLVDSKDCEDTEDYESDDKNGSQEHAGGIKTFCQVFMTDALTSSSSSGAKALTTGLTLEGTREEGTLDLHSRMQMRSRIWMEMKKPNMKKNKLKLMK